MFHRPYPLAELSNYPVSEKGASGLELTNSVLGSHREALHVLLGCWCRITLRNFDPRVCILALSWKPDRGCHKVSDKFGV